MKQLAKILVSFILLGGLGYGAWQLWQPRVVGFVWPKFIAQRDELTALLGQLVAAPDINLTSLASYENKKDWVGALKLLNDATEVSNAALDLTDAVIAKTTSLMTEAQKIDDMALRQRGVDAILDLQNGNRAMKRYLDLRAKIIETLWDYYAKLMRKEKAPYPDLAADLQSMESFTAGALDAYASFNSGIAAFDKAAGIK